MARIIEVIVSPQGEVTVRTKGYTGGACIQASKFLESALGVVGRDAKTAEFYSASTEQHVSQ